MAIKTIPQLKKNDKVTYYGAIFNVLENPRNVSFKDEKPHEQTVFAANCEFVSYVDGSGKKGDWMLETYNLFQGNSYASVDVID